MLKKYLIYFMWLSLTSFLVVAGLVLVALSFIYPKLPSLESMTDYRPKVPLRIFTADDQLIGEFGDERRAVVKLDQVPLSMQMAILAAEDERFYQHGAVDFQGVLRAVVTDVFSGHAKQGASTITMQVARNFFLSDEKTYTRKLSEVLLAYKIEKNLSKKQILELYINQIYLGQRAYGFGAAAWAYYNKPLDHLSIAEMAMLAGLPKAPSKYNPIANPKRAALRQQYVLKRMKENSFISEDQYQEAIKNPGVPTPFKVRFNASAGYVAEMVRQYMVSAYGEEAYSSGFKVVTTLLKGDQEAANQAVVRGVIDYEKRHGYHGPEDHLSLPDQDGSVSELEDQLVDKEIYANLYPALVLSVGPKKLHVFVKTLGKMDITGSGLSFVAPYLNPKAKPTMRIQRGSVIRVTMLDHNVWQVVQVPEVQAALVSMDAHDGAVRALVGGFDFALNKYNHVTQAYRQPGSSFKPFIYSAAFERGYTPSTLVDDLPLVVPPEQNGGQVWEPHNYENEYLGSIPLRLGLAKSKNMVAIRVLSAITPSYARQYITRFGFDLDKQPPFLSLALGSGEATPMQMVNAYAILANGGFKLKPYYIDRILNGFGQVISRAQPVLAGEGADLVVDPRNAFMVSSMMQDVIRQGTATAALSLGRMDLAGKTGTTNDHVDAWFCGFQPSLVAVAWMGFDKPASLGAGETGAKAALPMWIDYMRVALRAIPESPNVVPQGIDLVPISPRDDVKDESGQVRTQDYQYGAKVE